MKHYCPTLLLAALLAWAIFAAVAWGGGPDDPYAPVGVRPGAVSSTGVYTGTSTGTAVATYPTFPMSGLVAAYLHNGITDNYVHASGASGTWADYATSSNDLAGADDSSSPAATSNGVDFDGSDDGLFNTTLDFGDLPLTAVFRVENDCASLAQMMLSEYSGPPYYHEFFVNASCNLFFYNGANFDTGYIPTTGVRHTYVVYMAASGNSSVYVDGTEYSGSAGNNAPGAGIRIGNYATPGFQFDGRIRGILVYNRALSTDEISSATAWIDP